MQIVINSDPKLLSVLRGVVRYRAQEMGFSESDAEALASAVNEAASNVIRHTYHHRHDGRLALQIRSGADRMEFVLEDSGPKVRAGDVRALPLGEIRKGGVGLHLIQGVMDTFDFDDEFKGGNRLKMSKRFPRKDSRGDETET
jgi:anti-sigma regulatory factor (Ser/Thr protein kinase)